MELRPVLIGIDSKQRNASRIDRMSQRGDKVRKPLSSGTARRWKQGISRSGKFGMPHALLRGMEHTASIERPFLTSTSPLTLRRALACVNTVTWLLLGQTACYAVRAKVGFGSSFSAVVISVGI